MDKYYRCNVEWKKPVKKRAHCKIRFGFTSVGGSDDWKDKQEVALRQCHKSPSRCWLLGCVHSLKIHSAIQWLCCIVISVHRLYSKSMFKLLLIWIILVLFVFSLHKNYKDIKIISSYVMLVMLVHI